MGSDYCAFLNATAVADSQNLFDEKMESDLVGACVTREGEPGNFFYHVIAGKANAPISFVSFKNAALYCNWKNNPSSTSTCNITSCSSDVDQELKSNQLSVDIISSLVVEGVSKANSGTLTADLEKTAEVVAFLFAISSVNRQSDVEVTALQHDQDNVHEENDTSVIQSNSENLTNRDSNLTNLLSLHLREREQLKLLEKANDNMAMLNDFKNNLPRYNILAFLMEIRELADERGALTPLTKDFLDLNLILNRDKVPTRGKYTSFSMTTDVVRISPIVVEGLGGPDGVPIRIPSLEENQEVRNLIQDTFSHSFHRVSKNPAGDLVQEKVLFDPQGDPNSPVTVRTIVDALKPYSFDQNKKFLIFRELFFGDPSGLREILKTFESQATNQDLINWASNDLLSPNRSRFYWRISGAVVRSSLVVAGAWLGNSLFPGSYPILTTILGSTLGAAIGHGLEPNADARTGAIVGASASFIIGTICSPGALLFGGLTASWVDLPSSLEAVGEGIHDARRVLKALQLTQQRGQKVLALFEDFNAIFVSVEPPKAGGVLGNAFAGFRQAQKQLQEDIHGDATVDQGEESPSAALPSSSPAVVLENREGDEAATRSKKTTGPLNLAYIIKNKIGDLTSNMQRAIQLLDQQIEKLESLIQTRPSQ